MMNMCSYQVVFLRVLGFLSWARPWAFKPYIMSFFTVEATPPKKLLHCYAHCAALATSISIHPIIAQRVSPPILTWAGAN